jgi:hypothetical protein
VKVHCAVGNCAVELRHGMDEDAVMCCSWRMVRTVAERGERCSYVMQAMQSGEGDEFGAKMLPRVMAMLYGWSAVAIARQGN